MQLHSQNWGVTITPKMSTLLSNIGRAEKYDHLPLMVQFCNTQDYAGIVPSVVEGKHALQVDSCKTVNVKCTGLLIANS